MTDVASLSAWLEKIGFDVSSDAPNTLRVVHRREPDHAPFFVQCAENWVMLSMLPLAPPGASRSADLGLRLLAANREMRVAKFALDPEGAVVLCAELPTESLDYSELEEACERMLRYAANLRSELAF